MSTISGSPPGMIQKAGSSSWMSVAPAATAALSSALMNGTSAQASLPLSAYAGEGSMRNAWVTGPWSALTNGSLVRDRRCSTSGTRLVAARHAHRRDRAEGIELVGARVAQAALVVDRLQAVDAPVEVAREVGAQHLAVGHDVVARLVRLTQRQLGAVLERLIDVRRAQLALRDRIPDEPHPGGHARAADGLDREQRQVAERSHGQGPFPDGRGDAGRGTLDEGRWTRDAGRGTLD